MKTPIQALENCHSTRITSLTYRILSSIAYRNIVKKDDRIQEFAHAKIPGDLPSEIKANILRVFLVLLWMDPRIIETLPHSDQNHRRIEDLRSLVNSC